MKEETTTYGASLKKVVEFLHIGADICEAPDDSVQRKADLLSDRLSDRLPLYYSPEQKPSRRLKRLGETIAALAGEPVGRLLEDPKTDSAIIRMTKDYGRRLSVNAESEAEHHTANTIYYAAIAHALVCHGLKITRYSYGDLQKSFLHLSGRDWIPENLCDLFRKASEYCGVRAKFHGLWSPRIFCLTWPSFMRQ